MKDLKRIFPRYSWSSKAYKVFNNRTLVVKEYVHVAFDETKTLKTRRGISSIILGVNTEDTIKDNVPKVVPPKDEDIKDDEEESEHKDDKKGTSNQLPQDWNVIKDYLLDKPSRYIKKGVSICLQLNSTCNYSAFTSQVELKIVSDAFMTEGWILAMQ